MVQRIVDTNPVVTLEELKDHLHIVSEDFDSSLQLNIRSAMASAEAFLSRPIARIVNRYSVPFEKTVPLPSDYDSIEEVMVDGKEVEFTILNNSLSVGVYEGEELTYCVVYGFTSSSCPADIKMAIMLTAARFFNNPVDSVEQLPKASTSLLRPHKRYNV